MQLEGERADPKRVPDRLEVRRFPWLSWPSKMDLAPFRIYSKFDETHTGVDVPEARMDSHFVA
jgi:hypothetical protein